MEGVRVNIPSPFTAETRNIIFAPKFFPSPTILIEEVDNEGANVPIIPDDFNRLLPIQKEVEEALKRIPPNENIYNTGMKIIIYVKLPIMMINFLAILSRGEIVDQTIEINDVPKFERGISTYIKLVHNSQDEHRKKLVADLRQSFKQLNLNPENIRSLLIEKSLFLVHFLEHYDFASLDVYARTIDKKCFETRILPLLIKDPESILKNNYNYKVYLLVVMICYYSNLRQENIIITEQLLGLLLNIVPMFIYPYIKDLYTISLYHNNHCASFGFLVQFLVSAFLMFQHKDTPTNIIVPCNGDRLESTQLYGRTLHLLSGLDKNKTRIQTVKLYYNSVQCLELSTKQNTYTEQRSGEKRPPEPPTVQGAVKQRLQSPSIERSGTLSFVRPVNQ